MSPLPHSRDRGGELHRASEPLWRQIQRLIISGVKSTKVCVRFPSDKLWFGFRPLESFRGVEKGREKERGRERETGEKTAFQEFP